MRRAERAPMSVYGIYVVRTVLVLLVSAVFGIVCQKILVYEEGEHSHK